MDLKHLRTINDSELAALNIPPAELIRWVDDALRHKADALLPPKMHMIPKPEAFMNIMPSILPWLQRAGCKIVSRYPGRQPAIEAQLLLYNSDNGELLALLGADYLTALRTGAVAAHSMRLLAKSEVKTLALLGLGLQMREAIRIYIGSDAPRPLTLRLMRYKDAAERFQTTLQNCLSPEHFAQLRFEVHDRPETLFPGADIVVSAPTYLENDVCSPELFDPGVLLVPIHTRGYMGCDLVFDKIYGDDRGHVENFRYFHEFPFFAEVADVLTGRASGRESDKERILAYNIGLSLHDIYFAAQLLEHLG